jgi:hypothetical protein
MKQSCKQKEKNRKNIFFKREKTRKQIKIEKHFNN